MPGLDGGCLREDHPLRRPGRYLPPAGGPFDGLPGLHDRAGGGAARHHPPGVRAMAAINQCSVPWCTVIIRNAFGVAGAIHQPAPLHDPLCLALGALGLAAAGRRDRGRLPGRYRCGGGPRGEAERDRDPAAIAAQPAADGRGLLGGGDHRPPADPPAALRIRRLCGEAAGTGRARARHPPLRGNAGRGRALPVRRRSTGSSPRRSNSFLWPRIPCCGNSACS